MCLREEKSLQILLKKAFGGTENKLKAEEEGRKK
jgi:hypothetical protein